METVTSADGTTIAFDRYGDGPALILVGGAFQHRAFGPEAVLARLLSAEHGVVQYDRRGRGDSTDTPPYAVEREVEDIAALIEASGGRAGLFGMSSGAVLALEAAANGLPVDKLAMYEPPFSFEQAAGVGANATYAEELRSLLAEGRRGDAAAHAMRYFGAPPEMIDGIRQAPVWPLFEAVAPTLLYDATIMGDASIPTERAASVAVPALVLAGGASPDWMRDAAAAMADALPGGRLRTLEGQTHEVDPEVLAPVLLEFFAD